MSVVALKNGIHIEPNMEPILVGEMIVIRDIQGELVADAFIVDTDDLEAVIGVSFPKEMTSGRIAANIDGPLFYLNADLVYGESMQLELDPATNDYIPNPNANPLLSVFSDNYVFVAIKGLVPILKEYSTEYIPQKWKRVRIGEVYDWYVI
jgi:hypothetical protein